jgi:dolichol-phosphate mannosyltransferase
MSDGVGGALVIVPTWNEVSSIASVVERLFERAGDRVELLVVDDGSPDGTAEVVRSLSAGRPAIHLLVRAGKRGLGTAYQEGFAWALERTYEAVVEMDADGSHEPGDVVRLLDALAGADLVIGSRYVAGGRIADWGLLRRALSRAGNTYARLWLGLAIRDSTSGFRAYRSSLLAHLDPATVRSEGYAFQIEMALRAAAGGARVVEIPITFTERTAGRSKMSRAIVLEALARVSWWGLRGRLRGRRRVGAGARS